MFTLKEDVDGELMVKPFDSGKTHLSHKTNQSAPRKASTRPAQQAGTKFGQSR